MTRDEFARMIGPAVAEVTRPKTFSHGNAQVVLQPGPRSQAQLDALIRLAGEEWGALISDGTVRML